jgi:hypothetical protein
MRRSSNAGEKPHDLYGDHFDDRRRGKDRRDADPRATTRAGARTRSFYLALRAGAAVAAVDLRPAATSDASPNRDASLRLRPSPNRHPNHDPNRRPNRHPSPSPERQ